MDGVKIEPLLPKKEMANEKLGVVTVPSPGSLVQGSFTLVQRGLTF